MFLHEVRSARGHARVIDVTLPDERPRGRGVNCTIFGSSSDYREVSRNPWNNSGVFPAADECRWLIYLWRAVSDGGAPPRGISAKTYFRIVRLRITVTGDGLRSDAVLLAILMRDARCHRHFNLRDRRRSRPGGRRAARSLDDARFDDRSRPGGNRCARMIGSSAGQPGEQNTRDRERVCSFIRRSSSARARPSRRREWRTRRPSPRSDADPRLRRAV